MNEQPALTPAACNSSLGLKVAVCFLLALYWTMAVLSKENNCNTFDELAHIVNGTSFWRTHDFRLAPESILIQRWAALPIALGDYRFPGTDSPEWHASKNWSLGFHFLFRLGNNADEIVRRGRMMIALLGAALGLAVFLWSRRLFGNAGGLISLIAFTFCPTMLTHGALVTADMGTALFFLLSVAGLWTVLHRVTLWTVLGSSLAVGALFVSKMSAVLIVPMSLLLLGIKLAGREPMQVQVGARKWLIAKRGTQAQIAAALIGVHVLGAWLVIWAMFEFRFDMFREPQTTGDGLYGHSWKKIAESGRTGAAATSMRQARLLPEGYLYAFANSLSSAQQRTAFLNGEVRETGWLIFFPYCFLVKTPLPLFLLLGLALAGPVCRARPRPSENRFAQHLYPYTPLWTLLIVYTAAVLMSQINIGQRHLLPIYPVVLIWAGGASAWLFSTRPILQRLSEPRMQRSGVSGLPTETAYSASLRARLGGSFRFALLPLLALSWLVGETIYRWPHYLAYFNQLAGGPSQGYRHLVDSSLDWGQDLPGLRTWLKQNVGGDERVYLAYFGTADRAGVPAVRLPDFGGPPRMEFPPWQSGVYCISATLLQGLDTDCPGPWTAKYEETYQRLDKLLRPLAGMTPEHPAELKLFRVYDEYRLARLCALLRRREPDANVGYSILIYRVSDDDLRQALDLPLPAEVE